jgi:hypothetical protein
MFLCFYVFGNAPVLRRLCVERKDGAKLYFCAVFALFVFFVGIHIFFAKTKYR